LQDLDCPLVEGLFLREDESMQELLCTPSLHRLDILKWICVSVCPSLNKKLSSFGSSQTNSLIEEMAKFGYEMLLCQPDDTDLIKGLAPPLRQLVFLEQLLSLVTVPDLQRHSGNSSSSTSATVSVPEDVSKNTDFLREVLSSPHLPELLNPSCNPWPSDIRELLFRREPSGKSCQGTADALPAAQVLCVSCAPGLFVFVTRCRNRPVSNKTKEGSLKEVSALLQKTNSVLSDIYKECSFLKAEHPNSSGSKGPSVSGQALQVALSDLSQLMSAFSQVYATDFRDYCNREPPQLSSNAHLFLSVHQLLHTCNKELQALQQATDTSRAVVKTVEQRRQARQFWSRGEMHSLREYNIPHIFP
ncbi:HAUS7 protein, partial [Atractosteus spatula]|nr:HAUS7 protein [Atractosteus spatula]